MRRLRPPSTPAAGPAGGLITALVHKGQASDRVAVYLDGRRAFEVAAAVAHDAGLRREQQLSTDEVESLLHADAPYRAKNRALALLSNRDRCTSELARKLRDAGFADAVVAETLKWLDGLGYVDDRRFTVTYAAEKRRSGWGDRRIRSELSRRGVDRKVVEDVLAATEGTAPESEQGIEGVIALAHRRFAKQFENDPPAARRRLTGFLLRRGYDWQEVERIIRAVTAPESEDCTAGS